MGKLFGTDGIRGVVGENLTADMAFRVGQAVGTVLMEDKGSRPTVVIGKDTRISSDMLESALMAGLCSVGSDVKPVGTIPTPAVAYLTVQEKADAGIVISASHNPYEHNGIKVFSGQGYKLSDSVEARINCSPATKEDYSPTAHRPHRRYFPTTPGREPPQSGYFAGTVCFSADNISSVLHIYKSTNHDIGLSQDNSKLGFGLTKTFRFNGLNRNSLCSGVAFFRTGKTSNRQKCKLGDL